MKNFAGMLHPHDKNQFKLITAQHASKTTAKTARYMHKIQLKTGKRYEH